MITARNWRENLNFSFCRCFLYVWHFCNFEFYLPRPAEGRTKIMELWSCSQVIRGFHAIAIHRIKGSSSRQQSITTISNIVVLIEEIPCCCCFGVDLCTIIWYLYQYIESGELSITSTWVQGTPQMQNQGQGLCQVCLLQAPLQRCAILIGFITIDWMVLTGITER